MNSESEWGTRFLLQQSPRALTRTNSRAPLSPLDRNTSRAGSAKEGAKLRAVKSLDLESFRTRFPPDQPQTIRQSPRKLRTCRSMALRQELGPSETFREKETLITTLEDISDISLHSEDDRFQVNDLPASQVLDSDSESEGFDELSSESGHDYEHYDQDNDQNNDQDQDQVHLEQDYQQNTSPSSPSSSVDGSTPSRTESADAGLTRGDIETDSSKSSAKTSANIKQKPPGHIGLPDNLFSPPPAADSLGRSPIKRDSFDSDADPHSSRHRRALSRIAAIGEVPMLAKSTPDHTPLNSPKVDQMCIFTAADARTSDILEPAQGLDSLQNILSQLAQKERRVLEAEHALRDAKTDLLVFRERLNAMMDPTQAPLATICGRPRIITRRHQPNVGIHGLHYVQTVRFQPSPPAADDEIDEDTRIIRESIAFKFVHSLLGLVHCLISVLPRTRSITPQEYVWNPEYPSPTRFLYGVEL